MELPKLPEKPPELLEIEERYGALRSQRAAIESELRVVETKLGELRTKDEDEIEALAEEVADGTRIDVSLADLPARREDLRRQLDVVVRGHRKLGERVAKERERHKNRIVAAFRPAHKTAVRRIAEALEELVEANKAEQELRKTAPVQLVAMAFPNLGDFTVNNVGPAKYWRDYASRLGYFEPDEPEPETAIKRLLPRRRAKANGSATEAPPPMAAAPRS